MIKFQLLCSELNAFVIQHRQRGGDPLGEPGHPVLLLGQNGCSTKKEVTQITVKSAVVNVEF